MTEEEFITPKYDAAGLIPAIVQDDDTNAVLMVAWMNKEAYDLTRHTGQVHFWSRSRQEIWRKGATSGNTLTLVSLWIDCDADTLLVRVKPAGPACHTGNTTCFYRRVK
ncbi:phosphoribosyl-AMP cyclohydrolase [Leptolinea sp. HRD-7]|jgi:phosphoribosyl-AMP cyclohydrolase|nr:phosphoribosyl-AMP cyclohydrolase [Leptolinea sp. HRD-7]